MYYAATRCYPDCYPPLLSGYERRRRGLTRLARLLGTERDVSRRRAINSMATANHSLRFSLPLSTCERVCVWVCVCLWVCVLLPDRQKWGTRIIIGNIETWDSISAERRKAQRNSNSVKRCEEIKRILSEKCLRVTQFPFSSLVQDPPR